MRLIDADEIDYIMVFMDGEWKKVVTEETINSMKTYEVNDD